MTTTASLPMNQPIVPPLRGASKTPTLPRKAVNVPLAGSRAQAGNFESKPAEAAAAEEESRKRRRVSRIGTLPRPS